MEEQFKMDLNKSLTFERFVVGEENEFAYNAALKAVESPGKYNPIYLVGEYTGLGITHLLQAVAQKLKKKFPDKEIKYIDSKQYLNDYIQALQEKKQGGFREYYHDCVDYLVFDVTQFLSGKTMTQDDLLPIVDKLLQNGKQIVLGGISARKIKGLNSRLLSRFESGVTAEIFPPGFKLRINILTKIQQERKLELSEEILHLVAENITGNVRRLEGAMMCLEAFSNLKKDPVNHEDVKKLLRSGFNV